MDSDSNPFELIKVLCKAGFTIELSDGYPTFDAKISTPNGDLSDYAQGDTPEMAVLNAARDIIKQISEMADALRPYCQNVEAPDAVHIAAAAGPVARVVSTSDVINAVLGLAGKKASANE